MNVRDIQPVLEEFIFVAQAHRMGVFSDLAGNPSAAYTYAGRHKYNERAVQALFDALVELGYLVKKGEKYAVSKDGARRMVDRLSDDYEGHFWQFLYYLMDPWRTLRHVLKTGKPCRNSYKNFSMVDFIRGMDSPWKKKIAPEVVRYCLDACPPAKTVADIGGAPGTIARVFASRGLHTIIYDLPVSMKVMKKELSGIKNIRIVTGDATKKLPAGRYDIAFLGNICHGQSPDDNRRIISMSYRHLNPGGVIAIFDNIKGENRGAEILALHMITQSPGGNVYTRKEYLEWINAAGFIKPTVKKLSDRSWSLILARKL